MTGWLLLLYSWQSSVPLWYCPWPMHTSPSKLHKTSIIKILTLNLHQFLYLTHSGLPKMISVLNFTQNQWKSNYSFRGSGNETQSVDYRRAYVFIYTTGFMLCVRNKTRGSCVWRHVPLMPTLEEQRRVDLGSFPKTELSMWIQFKNQGLFKPRLGKWSFSVPGHELGKEEWKVSQGVEGRNHLLMGL